MAVFVSLRDFVNEMQIVFDSSRAYLKKVTGELITITDDDELLAETDEKDELIEWQNEDTQKI
jgi:hypothetical protein